MYYVHNITEDFVVGDPLITNAPSLDEINETLVDHKWSFVHNVPCPPCSWGQSWLQWGWDQCNIT